MYYQVLYITWNKELNTQAYAYQDPLLILSDVK